MKIKEIDVSKFGYEENVVVKRLTIGDRCDIEDEIMRGNIKIVNGKPRGDLPTGKMKLLYLEKSIVEAPFDMDKIRDIDADLGDYLLEEIDKLNSPLENGDETNPQS